MIWDYTGAMDETIDGRIDDVMETPALSHVEVAVSIIPATDTRSSLAIAGQQFQF